MLLDLSKETVRSAIKRYEPLFSRGDAEAILEEFADDAVVRYGSSPLLVGKDRLRELLQRRFSSMRDYQLSKQLEFICSPRIAASWTGSWVDVASGARMQSFGLELLTVLDGRFSEWVASVSVWSADQWHRSEREAVPWKTQ
jgi:nuclear transport factor 2 (NTF2) superfamily protein